MSREIDRRDFNVDKITSIRESELHSIASNVSDRLPGTHRIRIESFDAITGNPEKIASESALTVKGNYVQRALDYVGKISEALGFGATQPVEFVADPHVQETSSGGVTVHLSQNYKGIPIFHAEQAVRFDPNGTLKDSIGRSITISQEKTVLPILSVQEAVLKAAQHVAMPDTDEQRSGDQFGQPLNLTSVDLTGFVPKVIATFPDKSDRPTVLEAGPFGDEIKCSLIWFPLSDDLRLAWDFIIVMPNYEGQYRTIVDATNAEVLYCHQLINFVAARGNVFRIDGAAARQMTNFPRPWVDYGLPVPGGLPINPDDWVDVDRTVGNSTNAHQGISGQSSQGTNQNNVLTFDPANAVGVDQEVLNIFYYCCFMHDYFYILGFREADGNFQQNNFNHGGTQSDRVDARAHPGAVTGTANMYTPVDGSSPTMNMGLYTSTNRHTALDSTVVFHEFMHGVTNRLVGGPQNVNALNDPQSGGMGEGWGDYIACTINNVNVLGYWLLNNTGGIRHFPYDSNYPHNYGDVGKIVNGINYSEVHNMGEIWCATLMEMNRNIGATPGVQLVIDALKFSPANPSFLNMRNSILEALNQMLSAGRITFNQYSTFRSGIWAAFTKFGMGILARSNGASLSGIIADFGHPSAQGDDMQPGEVLNPGQSITSANGQYQFIYQGDGNLVLYRNRDGKPLWASNTYLKPVGVCIMQGDGNLVIYDPDVNPLWSSDTWHDPGSHLIVQDDGNVVIYRPSGAPIWATNTMQPIFPTGPTAQGDDMQPGEVLNPGQSITSANGQYQFIYQGDGNLVLYRNRDGKPLWASNTYLKPVGVCIMQGDGNLVIYDPDVNPLWSSDTWHDPGSHLIVQDDGNVVIYRPSGAPIWATNTMQPIFPTGPTAQGDDMQPGEVLNPGQSITSANGQYQFIYQGDGNLVLYRNRDGKPLWASNTYLKPVGVCIMQGDGNLVIYDPDVNPLWSSDTWHDPGSHLIVQDDGNVVIYRPSGAPIWATNTMQPIFPTGPTAQGDDMQPGEVLNPGQSITSANGQYQFIYQGDGNLVLYRNRDGKPLWASNTYLKPVGVCIMQGDGNLVIYDPDVNPLWSSDTWHDPGSHLIVQDDGNVVIYRPSGAPIWATNTMQP